MSGAPDRWKHFADHTAPDTAYQLVVGGVAAVPALWICRRTGLAEAWQPFVVGALALCFTFLVALRKPVWLSRLKYRLLVSEQTGISRVYDVPDGSNGGPKGGDLSDDARKALRLAVADALAAESKSSDPHLQILAVSGWKLIGTLGTLGTSSILYQTLVNEQHHDRRIEVLLLNPDGETAKARAETNGLRARYREGTWEVIWALKDLADQRRWHLDVRLYEDVPIWQLVLTPQEIWLQHVSTVDSASSPLHCLRRDALSGLGRGIADVWTKRWASAKPVDLSTLPRPNYGRATPTPVVPAHPQQSSPEGLPVLPSAPPEAVPSATDSHIREKADDARRPSKAAKNGRK